MSRHAETQGSRASGGRDRDAGYPTGIGLCAECGCRPAEPTLARGRLVLDLSRRTVTWDGHPVSLTRTQFIVVAALARRPGMVWSTNQLCEEVERHREVRGYPGRAIAQAHRVKKRFRRVDPTFDAIKTVRGVGRCWEER